jgi:transcription initiation factor IIE alpha subunit
MPNIETFRREVSRLRKQVAANMESQFHCYECGQPLKNYEHGELIRKRNSEDAQISRLTIKQLLENLSETIEKQL